MVSVARAHGRAEAPTGDGPRTFGVRSAQDLAEHSLPLESPTTLEFAIIRSWKPLQAPLAQNPTCQNRCDPGFVRSSIAFRWKYSPKFFCSLYKRGKGIGRTLCLYAGTGMI